MGRISKWSNLYTKQGKLIAKAPIKNLSYKTLTKVALSMGANPEEAARFANFATEKPNGIYIPKRHHRKRTA